LPVWQAGELVTEQVTLALPDELPPGSYDLNVGWYDESGRLLLVGESADLFRISDLLTVEDR
jgi:hypothetical protein